MFGARPDAEDEHAEFDEGVDATEVDGQPAGGRRRQTKT